MKTEFSRTSALLASATALAMMAGSYVSGQGTATPAPGAAVAPAQGAAAAPGAGARAGGGGQGGRATQWGRGPIRVMLVTHGHGFNPRDEFFAMFDALGAEIAWRSVEHPAADVLLQPKYSDEFDVYVFYDRAGSGIQAPQGPATGPAPIIPTGAKFENNRYYPQPSDELKAEFPKLLRQGNKGFVFLHHSNASWVHVWPEYVEVVGSSCDWGAPSTVRGIEHPRNGAFGNTPQRITIVDKEHPITKGVADFDITDEAYNCPFFEDSVHPLARTSFKPADVSANLNPKVAFSNLSAYVKTAENSPVAYIQMGHGGPAWANESYRQMVLNAIKWAASPEAKAWAKANPKKIFK